MDDIRTPVTGLGAPTEGEHPYLMWDAAYVLGSLSAADRREFEAHLAGCASCRAAVAELCGVPALLSQLGADEVAAIGEPGVAAGTTSGSPQMSSQLLPTLLATVRWRRRRTRLAIWVASSAAAVFLGIGVLVGVVGHSASAPVQTASAQPMAQVGTHLLESTVSVDGMHWGAFINLRCVCLAPPDAHHDTLAMVVVGRDGSQTRLATWVAEPGHTATPAGSISMPVDQIAAVQVVSADSGEVLLQRSL
ncbi:MULTISPECIES: anti-sigma factor family protein [Mycobacterium]|uniref:Anti-sigma-L factor RslA n=1 Tax=Mycobacterium pseudoshottsii TaxID=265949 RepID=A0A9N7LP35_9MYCO|nr:MULTISPECIES: zf-HC2 domain-containing protein [Mycobacterium]BBA86870.1 anti-sigma-L factor RslA [Mycobacterium pseudoshottsii JCM 15466]BDN80988.1 anti-sigma-L factor RslA [Mycobacterium pseudoshottsii]BEH75399.1 anti-sigma-L factor RslA [Mycobacterium pseudoshottsii]GAQ32205.1 membrane protein [Mycobacterium pseudoshottsii JCM 15466]